MEVNEGRKPDVIDGLLLRIHHLASSSDKEAQKLITAGAITTLIILLKARAVEGFGLEPVLMALGTLAYVENATWVIRHSDKIFTTGSIL